MAEMTDAAFGNLLKKLNKQFEETIFLGSDRDAVRDTRITFESPMMTYAFGGLLLGRIVHLFGNKSNGKSSIATYIAGQLQKYWKKQGRNDKTYVAYIDFERSYDIDYAEAIGMDVEKVIVIRAMNIEDAFTIWEELVKTGRICCTIFDSDATAPTRNELVDEVNKANFGAGALAVGRVLRRVNVLNYHYKGVFIHISQERKPMNALQKVAYTGGSAPEYYATYQFRITKTGTIEDDKGHTIGIYIRCRNFKNKGGEPFRDANITFKFKGGLIPEDDYDTLFALTGMVNKDSGHYDSDKYNIHVYGEPKYKAWLEANPETYEQMKRDLDNLLVGHVDALDNGNEDPLSKEEREAKEQEGKEIAEIVQTQDDATDADLISTKADPDAEPPADDDDGIPKMTL